MPKANTMLAREAGGPETRERAEKIGISFVQEVPVTTCPHCSAILFIKRGCCEDCGRKVKEPDKVRFIYDQWPLKRLFVRGILDKIQFNAGHRYYAHWYGAGLVKLGSVSFETVGSSREPGSGMAATERQAYHRQRYRQGEAALGPVLSAYVNAIVLQEQEPEVVGKRITGRAAPSQARAVAIEMLKGGLDVLAKEYALG